MSRESWRQVNITLSLRCGAQRKQNPPRTARVGPRIDGSSASGVFPGTQFSATSGHRSGPGLPNCSNKANFAAINSGHVGRVTDQRASSAGDLLSRLQQKVQALQGDPEEQQEETDVGLVIVLSIVSGRIADVEGFRRIACVEAYRVEPHEHRPDKFKHDWRKP